MEPTFFATSADFRAWLEAHHADIDELAVGFYKKGSGRASMTWAEAVDQALCFGWIDGVRRRIDEDGYTIRFTPRRARSIWSAVNIKRAQELIDEGLMRTPGLAAFERRGDDRSAVYSYEQRKDATLDPDDEKSFRADATAWDYFQHQAPWYRRAATHWVTSAKRAETRRRRLETLIEDSAAGRRIKPLRTPGS
ncbi:MAG: YdeI/OmpD-associated family protein [Actinomycetota bacterium]|nr:YdeI/OmpD-associated family protein [Actinomycetota bacterium]